MKKILGLDLGVGSIGWCLIGVDDENPRNNKIIGIGTRIIPLSVDETTGFTKGNGETPCSQRTTMRSMRRGMDRYQQRRKALASVLESNGMKFDRDLLDLDPMSLWRLRADAASGKKLSLPEIGRVLYHLNQRRGYKPAKGDDKDNSSSEYLKQIRTLAEEAGSGNLTPGQYFAKKLSESEYITDSGKKGWSYRIKEKVFPRNSYKEELETILEKQREYYPEILTEENIRKIVDVIFFQRPLKSCKHLVSICDFMKREYTNAAGKKVVAGPKVAPSTSPLAQVCRLWEAINNIKLTNFKNKKSKKQKNEEKTGKSRLFDFQYILDNNEREAVFDYLNENEKLSTKELLKILGLKNTDGFNVDKAVARGLKGNFTKVELAKALQNLPDYEQYLRFNIEYENVVDTETGEIFNKVSDSYLREPLYMLWHTLYSIDDYETLKKALEKKFGITDESTVEKLFKIDFRGKGYSNKSSKFICLILPYLMAGEKYSEACETVGLNHSFSLTKEENESRELLEQLPLLNKGDLRQPVVEKILNQLIHQVNDIIKTYGRPDEIRIELARTLKQNKEERSEDSKRMSARERENKMIAEIIEKEWNLRPSANKIQKYRMWEESGHCCMYCGKPVGAKEFLLGLNAEKEHIIPRSLFFDDSFSNKVCSCRECNATKGQKTGYDFMAEKGETAFNSYIERVEKLFNDYKTSRGKTGISKTKHDRLLTSRNEIPQDFIERDLRQSQYIAKKAMELLKEVCHDVYATSGSVTDFFRHAWGYDDILHTLNLRRYSDAGETEMVEYDHKGQKHLEERILGWTKRIDHRHHAVDALTIALTRQSFIQRLNTLNAERDVAFKGGEDQNEAHQIKTRNLEKWAAEQPHFSFDEASGAVGEIAVSFKTGKKVTTPGKRVIYRGGKRSVVQKDILVPRGPLTESSVYGTIKTLEKRIPLKKLFNQPELIVNSSIREAIERRLGENNHDPRKALASVKKKPLIVKGFKIPVTYADCWKKEYVIRYKISDIKYKNLQDIVDKGVLTAVEERFNEVGKDDKKFVASLTDRPVYRDKAKHLEIKSVRCFTGLKPDSMTPISFDEEGRSIGYSKYGNNNHIALYVNKEGKLEECVVPMFHAVKRKALGLPVIVRDPEALWEKLGDMNLDKEQELLSRFPLPDWRFHTSMQINDMFLIGLNDDEISEAIQNGDKKLLNSHLYRVQSLSSWAYEFRLHTHTVNDKTQKQIDLHNYLRIKSGGRFLELNPVKVRIDRLGNLSLAE